MRYWSYDPWRQLSRVRSEMNRIFSEAGRPHAAAFPPVNVWTGPDGVVVTAELPGVDPSKLEINAMRDTLTIRGERSRPETTSECSWHRHERGTGAFSRTVELPYTLDAESVDASCRDGVLRISMRRPEADKPRRIEVRSS